MASSFASLKSEIFNREERKQQYQAHIRGLNAYDRHKKFLKDYGTFYGKENSPKSMLPIKTDQDTLREGYRFIRSEEDDMYMSWEQRLVKRYYDKLFKEYCIADMSHYKSGKIGLRWRMEKEVISGKGQFICGNKHCDERDGLASYEVNFSYFEAGENNQALVKLVTCERCADKLNYKRLKEKEQSQRKDREKYKRKRYQFELRASWLSLALKCRYLTLLIIKKKLTCTYRDLSRNDDYTNDKPHKEKKIKEKETLATTSEHKTCNYDDQFDEFLEGMFL